MVCALFVQTIENYLILRSLHVDLRAESCWEVRKSALSDIETHIKCNKIFI
jgi:hypothetical protein